jgi:hypothetical protein
LLVAGMWANEAKEPGFDAAFIERIRAFATHSRRIYILSQVPMIALPEGYSGAVRRYFLAQAHDGPLHAESASQVLAANEKVRDLVARAGRSNVEFVDIYHCLCLPDGSVRISEDGHWLYSDHNHLNDTGAKYVFDHVLRPLLEQARAESVTAVTHSSAGQSASGAL